MATEKIPYMVRKKGAGWTAEAPVWRWFWQPAKPLRDEGFLPERLPDDEAARLNRARELNAHVADWRAGRTDIAAPPGTLGALIAAYKASDEYRRLADSTRRGYLQCLSILEQWGGDLPLALITPGRLKSKLYRKQYRAAPAFANAVMRVARAVFSWGLSEDLCAANPAKDVSIRATRGAPVIWPRAAVAAFVGVADALGRPSMGTAVLVNSWIGQRQGDLRTMARGRYRHGAGLVTQSKTGATVMLPIDMVPELAARLEDEAERQRKAKLAATTLIVSEQTGLPYRPDDFRHWMRWLVLVMAGGAGLDHMDALAEAARRAPGANTPAGQARIARLAAERRVLEADQQKATAAGVALAGEFVIDEGLRRDGDTVAALALDFLHLRHTAVTRLAVSGCTGQEIAAITGHSLQSVEKILDLYLVRNSQLARNAFAKRLAFEKESKS